MTGEKIGSALLFVALLAVGAGAWWLQLRPARTVDASALAALPEELKEWKAKPVALEDAVEAELRADLNLQRRYVDPSGKSIWAYVGYYGTDRGGRPEHTPRGCYTGAGWGIESARQLSAGAPSTPDGALTLNEYVVERDGQRQLVQFWYRSHRRTGMVGGLDQNVDRLLGRLLDGRADGALIRLAADVGDDETAVRSRLLAFAAELDRMVGERWPVETAPN